MCILRFSNCFAFEKKNCSIETVGTVNKPQTIAWNKTSDTLNTSGIVDRIHRKEFFHIFPSSCFVSRTLCTVMLLNQKTYSEKSFSLQLRHSRELHDSLWVFFFFASSNLPSVLFSFKVLPFCHFLSCVHLSLSLFLSSKSYFLLCRPFSTLAFTYCIIGTDFINPSPNQIVNSVVSTF